MKLTKTILAAATVGLLTFGAANANAGDWSVDFRIGSDRPERVWVDPVYEVRTERVWVEPVYEMRCERVWREAVIEERSERVWVPDRYERRDVRYVDRFGQVTVRCERVLVEPAHYAEVKRPVVVREAGWENVERRVLVREGGWQLVEKRVCVREGYWAYTPSRGGELDVRINRGDIRIDRARNDDADRYRDARERNRDQQRYDSGDRRESRDRGDRYR